jgi:HD-like signal output (HDOD) protein
MTIGFKGLKGIIIAAALRQMNKSFSPAEKMVWERSVATAICATALARRLKRRYVDELFLVGLLHSLGQVVLLAKKETAERYGEVLRCIELEGLDFIGAEERVFGFSHPLLGALVAKKWNFSGETCQVILHYRDSFEAVTSESEEQAIIVRLAEIVTHKSGIGSPPGYPDEEVAALELLASLGLEPSEAPEALAELVSSTRSQFEAERALYE